MWRYIAIAVSALVAATQYPALFQDKADEIVDARKPAVVGEPLAESARVDARENPLAGRIARIARDRQGHYVTQAKLNGRAVDVLVDTGATLVAINETTARRLGIRLQAEDFRYRVRTANGTTEAAQAMIGEIAIGRIVIRDVPALVSRDKALSTTLLGMSFLNKLKKFEFESGALVLTQ
jgi:aspartyl protease family protein